MNIFVINGHGYNEYAKGRLNKTLFDKIIEILSPENNIFSTIIDNGYDIKEEHEKFLKSQIVIYQMPIYWYSFPYIAKKYIEEVYSPKVFYAHSEKYGAGGLMTGKKYMFSLTWNSPKKAFYETSGFMDSRGIDEFIIPMHKLQQYCGFQKLPTFCCFDVVKNPDIKLFLSDLELHLKKYIINQ